MRANPTMSILEKGMKGFTPDSNTLILKGKLTFLER